MQAVIAQNRDNEDFHIKPKSIIYFMKAYQECYNYIFLRIEKQIEKNKHIIRNR